MATSSIYNSIKVRDQRFCTKLITSLEKSCERSGKDVVMSKRVKELNKEQIKEIFGDE